MTASVLSIASRALLEACERLGLDPAGLAAEAGLRLEQLRSPDARVRAEQADALWLAAYARSSDPALALHAVEQLPAGTYRVLHYLLANSGTLGDGLERACRWFDLVDGRVALSATVDSGVARLRMEIPVVPGGVPRPPAEYTLAALLAGARALLPDLAPLRVRFSFAEPADAAEHRRVFGCPVEYAAEHTELLFTRTDWNRRVPGADDALLVLLEQHAASIRAGLPDREDLLARLQDEVAAELPGGAPSLADVARRLGMSARTLQRRLAAEDTTFAAQLDVLRQRLARVHLADDDVALCEVAWLLGFSEQSAFTRAFKRWTGVSPSAWRSSRGPEGGEP